MLTVEQKATILAKAGSEVPPFPHPASTHTESLTATNSEAFLKEHHTEVQQASAVTRWKHDIDVLFSYYMAARAAKTLRDAESTRLLATLRLAAADPF
jgi:hypothetical protein